MTMTITTGMARWSTAKTRCAHSLILFLVLVTTQIPITESLSFFVLTKRTTTATTTAAQQTTPQRRWHGHDFRRFCGVSSDTDWDAPSSSSSSSSTTPLSTLCVIVDECDSNDQNRLMLEKAKEVADELGVPSFQRLQDYGSFQDSFRHGLVFSPWSVGSEASYSIGIQSLSEEVGSSKTSRNRSNNKKKNQKKPTRRKHSSLALPYTIDFLPPDSQLAKRSKGQTGSDLLVKAVSPRKGGTSSTNDNNDDDNNNKKTNGGGAVVYDLTAGFGQDSVILAQNGASSVTMVERDPAVGMLLQDALRRLCLVGTNDPDEHRRSEAQSLSGRLSLCKGDARDMFNVYSKAAANDDDDSEKAIYCDVCYVDPMFPPRQKRAAVKKNMQILHGLLGTQDDVENVETASIAEAELLDTAIRLARRRVVVKRPIHAGLLGEGVTGLKPSYDVCGSTNRWDVYVVS